MDQIAAIRAATLNDGRASGTRILHVATGSGLEFTVAARPGLDIQDFRHNGRSRAGIPAPASWRLSITRPRVGVASVVSGGMLTTCGLGNAGAPVEDGGIAHGLHGRIANTPAERLTYSAQWSGDDYVISISGELREARVFGPRLVMRRHIRLSWAAIPWSLKTPWRTRALPRSRSCCSITLTPGIPCWTRARKSASGQHAPV
jgi:hypothetical protein